MYLADLILGPEDKREYDRCMGYIVDACHRMASNKDQEYRKQQLTFASTMLDRMTELLEEAKNMPQATD